MYSDQVEIHVGDAIPITAVITAESGKTITISSGTFQLLKSDLSVVNNSSGGGTDFTTAVNVTGKDTGASSTGGTRSAYYLLSAANTSLLNVTDYYIGRFVLTGTDSDSNTRKWVVDVQIVVIYQ